MPKSTWAHGPLGALLLQGLGFRVILLNGTYMLTPLRVQVHPKYVEEQDRPKTVGTHS